MIVLDTNVVSEVLRPQPHPEVDRWAHAVPAAELCVTAITVAELWTGAALLPHGRRRDDIVDRTAVFLDGLGGPVLPFDAAAAAYFAQIEALQRARGRVSGVFDTQIAAVCLAHGTQLATRNVRDFAALDISLVNPWTA